MTAKLVFDGVSRRFGDSLAVEDLTLEVPAGSLTALVGPSGCGKSTLLEMGGGLQRPSAGEVRLDGDAIRGPGRETTMIFQHHSLFEWMTVRDNVAFGLRNRGVGRREARTAATAQLRSVGLGDVAEKVPAELSGGMRQRVALARALVLEPEVLLMDEPFASLDFQTRRVMQRHLVATWQRTQTTIVLVTHDLGEALLLADRVALMSGSPGRIAEVVDIDLPRPRDPDDPRLSDVGGRLEGHLEAEVAVEEFTSEELAQLDLAPAADRR